MYIRFYPLDFEYKLQEGKVYVCLYSRLESGEKVLVLHPHQPYFYARLKNIEPELFSRRLQNLEFPGSNPPKIAGWEIVERELLGKKEKFYKLHANYPKAVPLLSRELESWGVECFERDILFVHRYLRDTGILPMTLVGAEGEFIENPSESSFAASAAGGLPIFLTGSVRQESNEAISRLRVLALDIETYSVRKEIDPHKNPVLMAGFYGVDEEGKEFRKVITWRQFSHRLEYLEQVPDEIQLLQRVREVINSYKPDILTGYFSDGFDLPYLQARMEKHKVPFDIGAEHSEPLISKFRTGECKIRGMIHVDVLQFIRNIFGKDLKTGSFTLDAVAGELLGHQKHKVNLDELATTWDRQPEQLADYCAYNLHDAHLTCRLCIKLLPDMIEFTKLIGVPLFDVIRMRFSRLVESYILRRAREFGVIAPNKPSSHEIEQRMERSIQGAFVLQPTPGLYKDIVVFDFRSLYPTIITAHNLGPEGFRCACCRETPHVPEHSEYWFCSREKKFLPSVLEQLILRRADLKRLIKEELARQDDHGRDNRGEKNNSGLKPEEKHDTRILEARSYALKILANSYYGYLGFYGARWYCLECAAATTAYARNYIQHTIAQAQEKGFKVIYSDTDSLFLLLENKIPEKAMEFMNEINFDLPGHMELEFEGFYPRGIFVAVKHSEKGAKKKYALADLKGNLKIVGFESVRRNWSPIAKEVQERVLRMALADCQEEAMQYVKQVVWELKGGKVPLAQLLIRTQITRELQRYASEAPHVSVARKLLARGESVAPGTTVEYIIAKGQGLVRERARLPEEVNEGGYDADYYISHQLIPAVTGIFAVLGYKEDEVFKESSQVGLGKFFRP